jgi:hypothetical protein
MTALATALQRLWSAKSRLPRLTGRGRPACISGTSDFDIRGAEWFYKLLELGALAKRTAPTVVVIALRIFR